MLWPVAGGVNDAQVNLAQREHIPITERLVRIGHISQCMHRNHRSGALGKLVVTI